MLYKAISYESNQTCMLFDMIIYALIYKGIIDHLQRTTKSFWFLGYASIISLTLDRLSKV